MAKSQKVLKLCNWHFFPINYTFGPKLLFESVDLKKDFNLLLAHYKT